MYALSVLTALCYLFTYICIYVWYIYMSISCIYVCKTAVVYNI